MNPHIIRPNFKLIMLIFLLSLTNIIASTYYVSPSGNDLTGDGSAGNPWLSIQGAINNSSVVNGDIIVVKDGTYTENVNVTKEITIRSENGFSSTIVAAVNPNDNVFEVTAGNVTIDGFTVYGSTSFFHASIYVTSANSCTISNNRCGYDGTHNSYAGIWIISSNNCTISGNTCKYNSEYGIIMSSSNNTTVVNDTCTNSTYGCANSGTNNVYRGNVFELNGQFGLYISGGTVNLGNNDINDKGNNTFRNNPNRDVYNNTNNTVNAYYNSWGTNSAVVIDQHIYDNEEGKGEVFFDPYLNIILSPNHLQFSGVDSYITFGNNPNLGLSSFTLEAWIKLTGTGATAGTGSGGILAIPIITKGRGITDGSTEDVNYFMGIIPSTMVLAADFEEGAAGSNPGANHPIIGTTALSLNQWYHVAATYDGTDWNLYINGVLEGSLTVGKPCQYQSSQHAAIGSALLSSGASQGYFEGEIDEVRIWSTARTQQEIQDKMNTEITSPLSGLVDVWNMNEGQGSVVNGINGIAGNIINSNWGWLNSNGGVLPVELTAFSAIINGNSVLLNWRTATEVNNYGFEVERNVSHNHTEDENNVEWKKIGFVDGNGNSNSPKDYSFIDENLSVGKIQYRLKQIDNDGSFEYSDIVEVTIGAPDAFILFQNYPNPFNPSTKIKYQTAKSGLVNLKVYNVLGSEVAALVNKELPAGNHEVEFDASNLPSGIYFYTLNAGKFNQTKKMILLK